VRNTTPALLLSMALLLPSAARAQTPAPKPTAEGDEDIEIPAASSSTAPPQATQSGPTPAPQVPAERSAEPRPAGSPAAAGDGRPAGTEQAGSPESNADVRLRLLEARLAALEGRARLSAVREAKARTEAKEHAVILEGDGYSPASHVGFGIGGYVQADYLHSQASEDQLAQSGAPLNQNRFYVRRARFRADRGWKYAAATFELDANTVSGVNVGIRLAEVSVFYRRDNPEAIPPVVMLTAGITDLPFGYELVEADRTRVFMERSLASTALFPTKQDAGIKLSGAAGFLRYAVAVSNGEPVDSHGLPRDPNSAKDFTGRFGAALNPFRGFELTLGTSFAKGTGFHPGSPATKSTLVWQDQNEDGTAQTTEITGKPGSAATPSRNFDRWALGLDLAVRIKSSIGDTRVYGEIYASKNYDRGFLISDPFSSTSGAGSDLRQLGGYAAITQDMTEYAVAGFRYSVYDPNADVFEQRRGDFQPRTQTIRTLSPIVGLQLPRHARLLFEYDFVRDYLGRTANGTPTDAKNDTWTVRLQGNL
jgi:hypothetical protein